MQPGIFSVGGTMNDPVPDKRGLVFSASSPEHRSAWRLGGSADQCIEVKMPIFLGISGTVQSYTDKLSKSVACGTTWGDVSPAY
jgi:hypothetical protein